ncbi:MAG: hypothetical protein JW863_19980 [Chitinispirillaceae bacterium]|nr:hypothetical protein [Chitinispirillaceae bacterium]
MNTPKINPANRRGQFLWRDPATQSKYVIALKKRVSERYYFNERVFSRIVDEIAPVLNEITSR